MIMKIRGKMRCGAGSLLFVALLAHPGIALAQRSADASATVRFEVLPVHAVLGAESVSAPLDEKVTVAVEPAPQGGGEPSGVRALHMLLPPGRAHVRPPRGSTLVVTVTD
jgi:hypothetical protein